MLADEDSPTFGAGGLHHDGGLAKVVWRIDGHLELPAGAATELEAAAAEHLNLRLRLESIEDERDADVLGAGDLRSPLPADDDHRPV